MANTITKYDNLIKVLKAQVISEVNNTLSYQFTPIIEEINKDISTFNLLEKLDNLIEEMPSFKKLQSKYNNLLVEYNKLKNSGSISSENDYCPDISLVIKDIDKNNNLESYNNLISNSTTLNVKIDKDNDHYECSSIEDEIISDEETSSQSESQHSDDDLLEKGKTIIYTDGACKGNPGDGGWGAHIINNDGSKVSLKGGVKDTTNNRMELLATIKALEYFKDSTQIEINTDSKYVKDGITSWITSWKKNGWKTSQKKEVKNLDLWKKLDELCNVHTLMSYVMYIQ
jgi:ribonuclease HI